MDRQIKPPRPLAACSAGHTPRMYRAAAHREVTFYVECAPCGIRARPTANARMAEIAWDLVLQTGHGTNIVPFNAASTQR